MDYNHPAPYVERSDVRDRGNPCKDYGVCLTKDDGRRNEPPASAPSPAPSAPANVIAQTISFKAQRATNIHFPHTENVARPPSAPLRMPSKAAPSEPIARSEKIKELRREAAEIGIAIRRCKGEIFLIDIYDIDERTEAQNHKRAELVNKIDELSRRLGEIAQLSPLLEGLVRNILRHRIEPGKATRTTADRLRREREFRMLEARVADNLDNDLRGLSKEDWKNRGNLKNQLAKDRAAQPDETNEKVITKTFNPGQEVKRIQFLVSKGGNEAQMQLRELLKERYHKKKTRREDKRTRASVRLQKADPSFWEDSSGPISMVDSERLELEAKQQELGENQFNDWLLDQESIWPWDDDQKADEEYTAPSVWDDPVKAERRLAGLEFDHGLRSITLGELYAEEEEAYDPSIERVDANHPESIARWNRYVIRRAMRGEFIFPPGSLDAAFADTTGEEEAA